MMPSRALLCSAGSDAGGRTQCGQQGCGDGGDDLNDPFERFFLHYSPPSSAFSDSTLFSCVSSKTTSLTSCFATANFW